MRYDETYRTLATRAVRSTVVDVEAFIEKMTAAGYGSDQIEQMMLADIASEGPLFGKFFRGLGTAAEEATAGALEQGTLAGELMASSDEVADAIARFDLQDAIEDGDPEALEEVEISGETEVYLWVAELKNTCYRCLPLHGKLDSMRGWKSRIMPEGYVTHPDVIHEGWSKKCQCRLILQQNADAWKTSSQQEIGVLVRNKDVEGGKGTVRGITSKDIDRANAAVQKALDSEEGRKILAILGSTNAGEE